MKKAIVVLFVVSVVFTNHSFANGTLPVPKQIELSFNKEFGAVGEVSWEKVNNVYIGTFSKGSEVLSAYFQKDGAISGIARSVSADQLPLSFNRSSSVQFFLKNYSIDGILEYADSEMDRSSYYMQLENSKKIIIVKVDADGETEILRKQNKSNLQGQTAGLQK
jgi:hypothetical protein